MEHDVGLELLYAQAHLLSGAKSAGAVGFNQCSANFHQQPSAVQLFQDEGVKFLSEFQRRQRAGCPMLGNQIARHPVVVGRGYLLPLDERRGDRFGRVDSHRYRHLG